MAKMLTSVLPSTAEDLLMWKDVKKTGIVFGAINLLFFFFRFTKTPFVSIILYTIGGAVGLLTAWARFGSSVGRCDPCVVPSPLLSTWESVNNSFYRVIVFCAGSSHARQHCSLLDTCLTQPLNSQADARYPRVLA
jgi:Reticulon